MAGHHLQAQPPLEELEGVERREALQLDELPGELAVGALDQREVDLGGVGQRVHARHPGNETAIHLDIGIAVADAVHGAVAGDPRLVGQKIVVQVYGFHAALSLRGTYHREHRGHRGMQF